MNWKKIYSYIHMINLVFAIALYIFIVILDRAYLVKLHDQNIEWEKSMQDYPLWVESYFNAITSYFNLIVFPILLILYCYSPDKKFFVLASVVLGLKAFFKSFWALIYREERPFMIDQYFAYKKCFCVFGQPSGHVSNTLTFYLVYLYYFLLKRKVNFIIKAIAGLIFAVFIYFLCWSRLYFFSHFLNQVIFGATLGYLFFAIFHFLYRFKIMDNMFNEQFDKYELISNIKHSDVAKFEQQKLLSKFKKNKDTQTEQSNDPLIASTSKNQKKKYIFAFTIAGLLLVCFIIVLIVQQHYINNFEKKDDNYLSKTTCGNKCKKKGREEGLYISYDGFASTTPNLFAIGIILYLCFVQGPVRIQSKNYLKNSFWPIHRLLLRLVCHLISFLPLIIMYILVIKMGLKLSTYLIGIVILFVQFFFSIKVHVFFLTLFRCQIPGDLFYVPDKKFLRSKNQSQQFVEFAQLTQKINKFLV